MAKEMSALYPDIIASGSLGKLLRSALARQSSALAVVGYEELPHAGSTWWADAERDRRKSQVCTAVRERSFGADFSDRGVCLAWFNTDSIDLMANVLDAWCIQRVTTSGLTRVARRAKISNLAASYEAGPEAYVNAVWQSLVQRVSTDHKALVPVVTEAIKTVELRRLLPFTSLNTLTFSRCTGFPFSGDCPRIIPMAGGCYRVTQSSGISPGEADITLGEGDARQVVAMTIHHLPAGCGPALHGTAEDLGRATG